MHTNYYKNLHKGSTRALFLLIVFLCLIYIFIEHKKIDEKIQTLLQHPKVQYIVLIWKTKFWNVFIENMQKAKDGGPTIIETPHENPFNFTW
jgi:hypothetical protein